VLRVGGQHPGGQARQAGLGVQRAGAGVVQPQRLALQLLGVAADQFLGLGELLPDDQPRRVAPLVGAHAVEFAAGARAGRHAAAGARLARRQRRCLWLGRRVDQHPRRWAPHRPDAEVAQRKAGLGRQHRHPVQAAPRRLEADLHRRLALRWHVGPGPVRALQQGHADGMARRAARIGELDVQHRQRAGEQRLRRQQLQGQAAQRVVADHHAGGGAAGQQEGEQVAQVELVVDGGDQQHAQRGRQHPAGARGQDVDVALGEQQRVGQRQARLPPGAQARAPGPAGQGGA